MVDLIYKIAPESLWRAAQQRGVFAGTPDDAADGFIHFSLGSQLKETASKWFSGQGNLMVIAADPAKLGDHLRFEPSRGGALFPHLYSPLPLEAVIFARPLPLLPNGQHDFSGILGT
jgi:uncharacterized protein (DUF952 family)